MINTEALDASIRDSGLKKSYIAEKIGLTRFGFLKKCIGETEFKASEIKAISEILSLSRERVDEIFFG